MSVCAGASEAYCFSDLYNLQGDTSDTELFKIWQFGTKN